MTYKSPPYSTKTSSVRYLHSPSDTAVNNLLHTDLVGIIDTNPDFSVERIGLDTLLICYITNGKGSLNYANTTFELKKGTLFIIDCNFKHSYTSHFDDPLKLIYCHIHGPSSDYYYKQITKNDTYTFSLESSSKIITNMYHVIDTLKYGPLHLEDYCAMQIQTLLTELILLSHKKNKLMHKNVSANKLIEDIRYYIELNYQSKITVTLLAKQFSISESHLLRLFKTYTNQSLYDYIIKYRLTVFKSLLLNTDESIQSLAYQVGYNNHSNLSRYFKSVEGMTPKAFRDLYQ